VRVQDVQFGLERVKADGEAYRIGFIQIKLIRPSVRTAYISVALLDLY
jgi:hypothetical protein